MPSIAFDLEGPLSPNDHAYELMGLFPGGDHVFEVISRYDDLLVLAGRENYEPGDTLSLILPFLFHHGIGKTQIVSLAEKARLIEGAEELIAHLHRQGWQVCCITTTYRPYARRLTRRLGIPPHQVAATPFPRAMPQLLGTALPIAQAEQDILALSPDDDAGIKERLDRFFWQVLPTTLLASLMRRVKAVGGSRKVAALEHLCRQPLSGVAVVGDSITDFPMLDKVNRAGGLAVAFNANQYALPYATLGLASTHLSDLLPLLETWQRAGRPGAEAWVKLREGQGGRGNREHFHWLAGGDISSALPIHREIRRLVRSRAAALG